MAFMKVRCDKSDEPIIVNLDCVGDAHQHEKDPGMTVLNMQGDSNTIWIMMPIAEFWEHLNHGMLVRIDATAEPFEGFFGMLGGGRDTTKEAATLPDPDPSYMHTCEGCGETVTLAEWWKNHSPHSLTPCISEQEAGP